MKKIIIIAVIAGGVWYFFIRKPKVVAPALATPAPGSGTITVPVNPNPQDAAVLQLITEISGAYAGYNSTQQFASAQAQLNNALQPAVVNCLVAPCPAGVQVSDAVKVKALALIALLTQAAANFNSMVCKGGNCGGGANLQPGMSDNTANTYFTKAGMPLES